MDSAYTVITLHVCDCSDVSRMTEMSFLSLKKVVVVVLATVVCTRLTCYTSLCMHRHRRG